MELKIKNYIKDNTRFVILCCGALVLNFGLLFKLLFGSSLSTTMTGKIVLILLFFIINAISIFGIYISTKKNWALEKVFLVFGLIYGTVMVFALPIGRVPDEPSHFWRAYELSEFRFFTETTDDGQVGYYLPNNLKSLIREDYNEDAYAEIWEHISEQASEERSYTRGPADNYFVFNYIPQVIGIWFGKITGLPLIPTAYIARLFNMVFCVMIVYFCIKYIPILKKFLFLLGFTPIAMQAFSSVSADGSIICGGLIIASFALYMIYGTKRLITKKDLLLLLTACLMLCVTKPVYAPLCFILFFIPKERFGNIKNKMFAIFGLGAITLSFVALIFATFPALPQRMETVNSTEQLSFIVHHPLSYVSILAQSSLNQIMFFITRGIGTSLEWFSVSIAEINILLYILVFVLICAEEKTQTNYKTKVFAFLALAASIACIFTGLYLSWSEVGAGTIDGVQGRYFLPLAMLVPLLFLPIRKFSSTDKQFKLIQNSSIYILTFFTISQVIISIISTHI